MSVLYLLVLLCPLSAAGLENNEVSEQIKVRPEVLNVAEQPQPCPADVHAVLREMSAKLAELHCKMEQVVAENREQAVKLKELQMSQDPMKEQLRGQAAELNRLKAQTNVTEDHVDSLRRDRAVGQVAFSATLLASGSETIGPFNTHTTLIFRHVVSNIGNAYNPDTGFFTAPVRGVYHFEINIWGPMNDSGRESGAWLMKNGQYICMAYESQASGWAKSSNGVSLLLNVGDVVFLRQYANSRVYDNGYHHTMFSGHLLFLR